MADHPSSALALDRVRRLAKQDRVEVEHLLALATLGDASVVPVLVALKAIYGWPQRGRIPGSTERFVPLGRWTDYVCAYLVGGCSQIAAIALDPEELALEGEDGLAPGSLALGTLASIRTPLAVDATYRVGQTLAGELPRLEHSVRESLGTLNQLLCFKPEVLIEPDAEQRIRLWVHSLLAEALQPATVAMAYCVLRAVGDEASITLIRLRPPLIDPWAGLAQAVIRSIRLRASRP